MVDVFTKRKRSQVLSAIQSKGNKDTELRLVAILRGVCTNCNEGLQNAALPKPDKIWLLAQVRRATIDNPKAVLKWLLTKFDKSP